MKFNNHQNHYRIKFGIYLREQPEIDQKIAIITTTNSISSTTSERLQNFINTLLLSDPLEFYIRQLEVNTAQKNQQTSGLGFVTIMNDYGAKLGWKFETIPQNSDIMIVTTMVQIQV